MPHQAIDESEPSRLAALLWTQPGDEPIWRTPELSAVLRHQLAAPLLGDLYPLFVAARAAATGTKPPPADDDVPAWVHDPGLRTFADLFGHPRPPLELLELARTFAVTSIREGTLPREVATAIYYLSGAVALVRRGARLDRAGEGQVADGVRWALAQAWLDEQTRATLREGLAAVGAAEGVEN